ncbi:MAG: FecR domain-containing protein [Phycisphaerae bacterium]
MGIDDLRSFDDDADAGLIDRYLWERRGPADKQTLELERRLRPLRYRHMPLILPDRSQGRRWPALAASIAILLGFGISAAPRESASMWEVSVLAGAPKLQSRALSAATRLGVGQWLSTDGGASARISNAELGAVSVQPGSRLRLLNAERRRHRMELARGRIEATINAPPRLFFVNTPSGVAADMGCQYQLEVDDAGVSSLRVTLGYVALSNRGVESMVPAGASCRTRPGQTPDVPHYDDAPDALVSALTDWQARPQEAAMIDSVLARARPRDAMTVWHLLARVPPDRRDKVAARLAQLVPPPDDVRLADALRLDRAALDGWWRRIFYGW